MVCTSIHMEIFTTVLEIRNHFKLVGIFQRNCLGFKNEKLPLKPIILRYCFGTK